MLQTMNPAPFKPITQSNARSFSSPKVLWGTWIISAVLLIVVGGALLFKPALAIQYWPWRLTPFNQRFLGAIYLSAAIPLLGYVIRPRLSVLRLLLPIFAFFTTYVFGMSLGYWGSFLARTSSQIWLLLYGAVSVIGCFYCWKFRRYFRIPSASMTPLTYIYRGQALFLVVYGLGLLIAPHVFAEKFWLWPLDQFHSHLYAGVFLTGALIQAYLGQQGQNADSSLSATDYNRSMQSCSIIFGMTHFFIGVGIALGIWILDLQIARLNWHSPMPWLWQLFWF